MCPYVLSSIKRVLIISNSSSKSTQVDHVWLSIMVQKEPCALLKSSTVPGSLALGLPQSYSWCHAPGSARRAWWRNPEGGGQQTVEVKGAQSWGAAWLFPGGLWYRVELEWVAVQWQQVTWVTSSENMGFLHFLLLTGDHKFLRNSRGLSN